MPTCVDLMAEALKANARGDAVLPERVFVWLPDQRGVMIAMPSYLGSPPSLGLKVVTLFPGNAGSGFPVIQGGVLFFEPEHGRLLAVMDGNEITAIRTAAVSGLATGALAREDAGDLALLGAGVQGRTHLAAMASVRSLRRVRVWSRTMESAARFAHQESGRYGVEVEPVERAEDAVRGADIICTVTNSREPVLHGAWLSPGAHVNAVGVAGEITTREVDTETIVRSRVYVDGLAAVYVETGDILIPIQEGAIDESHIVGELGQVLVGEIPGRTSPDDITFFKSFGLAVEDAAAAHHIYSVAVREGVGTPIDMSV